MTADRLDWKQADDDVHVATRDGEFAGFVEFDGTAHVVHDSRGAAVGTFDTLGDARTALEAARRGGVRRPRFSLRRFARAVRA